MELARFSEMFLPTYMPSGLKKTKKTTTHWLLIYL